VVVPDVRFPNELAYLRSKGAILVRLVSPERTQARLESEFGSPHDPVHGLANKAALEAAAAHVSETALDNQPLADFDFVIANDPANAERVAEVDFPAILVAARARAA
jgi:hypothetical protein